MTARDAHFDAMIRRSTGERPIRDNAAIWSADGPRILRAGRSHPLGQALQRRLGFVQRHANGPGSGARLDRVCCRSFRSPPQVRRHAREHRSQIRGAPRLCPGSLTILIGDVL